MSLSFVGSAQALSQAGLTDICARLSTRAAEVWTVIDVETSGCGFLPNRRPEILFERHTFSAFTRRVYDAAAPDISSTKPGGYLGGALEYERLAKAFSIEPDPAKQPAVQDAALRATSWGIGQVMGFNFWLVGFSDVPSFVQSMLISEDEQLLAFTRFLLGQNLEGALQEHDWAQFARGYNGIDYAAHQYDVRLASRYELLRQGALPNLTVRAAQLYLSYLGYSTGGVDGIAGRRTYAALAMFQEKIGVPVMQVIDDQTIAQLAAEVAKLQPLDLPALSNLPVNA